MRSGERRGIETGTPLPNPGANPQPRHIPGITFSDNELALLRKAFPDDFEKIFVQRELKAGLSGARVVLVQPGEARAHLVAKFGPPASLNREWDAYKNLVENSSPQNTARLLGKPIVLDDGQLALICYVFTGGDPDTQTYSLRSHYQERGGYEAAKVLANVFRRYGQNWWLYNKTRRFTFSEEYDPLLPAHLMLRLEKDSGTPSASAETSTLLVAREMNTASWQALSRGDQIRLIGFTVGKIRSNWGQITLIAPPPQGEATANVRLLVEGIDPTAYQIGDQIEVMDAVVTATRHSLLKDRVEMVMPGLGVEAAEISLGDETYPNPLHHYKDLLNQVTRSRVSIIHGDLNLENILVDRETGFAWLIDFADTRQGPALYDLQLMEAQVITKLLPSIVSEARLGPEVMVELYRALHTDPPTLSAPHPALQELCSILETIRGLARQFLMNYAVWDEYYRGLVLTLLGTLKYVEINTTGHALAFTAAAMAQSLIGTPLEPAAIPDRKITPRWLRPIVVSIVSLILITSVILGGLWLQGRQSTMRSVPMAFIAGSAGRVEILRETEGRVQPAIFGLDLFHEDAVLTYEGAAANVLCRNGLLFHVGPSRTLVVRCQETDDYRALGRLDPQVSDRLLQASGEITVTLAPAATRAVRAHVGQVPILIGPRNTAIATPRPTWHWGAATDAETYRLSVVNAVSGERWEVETTTTELTYPDDAPSLMPDTTYLTRLETKGPDDPVDESYFFLLDPASRDEVKAAEEAIRALSLDRDTRSFLLVRLYQDRGLWETAIGQLKSLTDEVTDPELGIQLGNLYFQVGLYSRAEASYQAALVAAQQAEAPMTQAGALVGLGRVADAFNEKEAAIEHFQSAEALYRAAGDLVRADTVAQILADLVEDREIDN